MKYSWLLLASFLLCGSAAANTKVTCTSGCIKPPDAERTPTLLVIDDAASQIELTWTSNTAPPRDETLTVRAGIPEAQDKLEDLGKIELTQQGDVWQARRIFPRAQLGHGTFIVATLANKGSRQRIVDWRPFYFRTVSELETQEQGAEVTGGHSVDLVTSRLQVTSAHGQLPNNTGGDLPVWWNVPAGLESSDLDIDGEHTGVAGIKVTRSPVWESRGDDWRTSIRENLPDVVGHFIDFSEPQFDDLKFKESRSFEAKLQDQGTVLIKHYYGAITLFTNATHATYRAQDLGRSGNKRYFSHETSANFRQKVHPKLWSSYSRRQYGGDAELLELIASTIDDAGVVPGLSHIQLDDGDGGDVTYKVGFKARVAPWSVPDDARTFSAGFVHVDVVAVRTGFGGVDTQQDVNDHGFCKLFSCKDDTKIDLRNPPRGWTVAMPTAYTGTQSGSLEMISGKQLFAQRSAADKPAGSIELPASTEFAVAAHLRAGALVKDGGFFGPEVVEMVPINSYAQFVVKYTVAMVPKTELVVSDEAILPRAHEFNTSNPVVIEKTWWQKFRELVGTPGLMIIALVLLVLAGFFLPPVAAMFRAIARLFVAAIDGLRKLIT